MSNAKKFKETFGIYATELWAMPEAEFLEWLNADCKEEPQMEYDKGLQLFANILFDEEKSVQFLRECKAMGIEPQMENLEQFKVDLEYHTDTTHFSKVKGESITTNKTEDEPQTEREGEG